MKFRTKPFEIEAERFDGSASSIAIIWWMGADFRGISIEDRTDPDIVAEVFDELHSTWVGVKVGQWIIKGAKGEFYPCDPEKFAAKYEEVV